MSLIGYWKFNTDGSDFSGNGHTATLVGAIIDNVVYKLGGGSLYTDGFNDYAWVADHADLDGFDDFTFRFWIKSPYVSGERTIIKGIGVDKCYDFLHSAVPNKIRLTLSLDGSASSLDTQSTATVFDDTWHHVVFTRIGSTIYLYVDNNKETFGTLAGTLHASAGNLFLGIYPSLVVPSEMNMDGLAIYNDGWSDADVNADWNGGAGREISFGSNIRKKKLMEMYNA